LDTSTSGGPLPVVGLGASAGGLKSIEAFFKNLTANNGLAYVIVVHLDPTQESHLVEIVAKYTALPVHFVDHEMELQKDHVYVLAPGKALSLAGNRLLPRVIEQLGKPTSVIDVFFQSLADQKQEAAIGVVMSGVGDDGTKGIERIYAAGGVCLAESPDLATHPEMPQAAIASGCVDLVASAKQLAEYLANVSGAITENAARHLPLPSQDSLDKIFAVLAQRCQIDFSQYKETTLLRRLHRRILITRQPSVESYITFLGEHREEVDALCDDFLIKVTEFFRDADKFELLARHILPKIIENHAPEQPLRIWVAGCSSGEEAYSLGICLIEYLEKIKKNLKIQIFGTDVSQKAIDKARQAFYDRDIQDQFSKARLRRFFSEKPDGFVVNQDLRDICVFAVHNLCQDPPFSQIDLISCRNFLIYLKPQMQKQLISSLHYALKPNGFLWLGSSEAMESLNGIFEPVDRNVKVYRKIGTSNRLHYSGFNLSLPSYSSPESGTKVQAVVPDENKIKGQAEKLILTTLGPAGWVITQDDQIVHILGDTSPYIAPSVGMPSFNLYKVLRRELHAPVRLCLSEVKKNRKRTARDRIKVDSNNHTQVVRLQIDPLGTEKDEEPYFLITIKDLDWQIPKPADLDDMSPQSDDIVTLRTENSQLREELNELQTHIHEAMEQQETLNNELKASNEELLSSNEELRSTNEELQTTQEELQSTNEELGVLNDELRSRNEDLCLLSDDLENFVKSIQIPVIMVDKEHRIRRFTPSAKDLFNLIETDTARPISDLKPNFDLPELTQLVSAVIDKLQMVQQDIQDHTGEWYMMQVRPYVNSDLKIDGAVLSFIDITERKKMELVDKRSNALFQQIVAAVRDPLLILDGDLIIREVNERFLNYFRIRRSDAIGRSLLELGDRQWDLAHLKAGLESMISQDKTLESFEVDYVAAGGERWNLRLSASQLTKIAKDESLILLCFEDMSSEVAIRRQADELERRSRAVFDEAPIAIGIFCEDLKFIQVNSRLCELIGLSEKSLLDLTCLDIIEEQNRDLCRQQSSRVFDGEIRKWAQDLHLVKSDGERVRVKGTLCAIDKDGEGRTLGVGFFESVAESTVAAPLPQPEAIQNEEVLQAKTDFLATMSHEIRTPLTSILGYAELLADPRRDISQLHEFAQRIRNHSKFLRNLVEEILDLSKIEAGRLAVHKKIIDLNELLGEVVDGIKALLDQKPIQFDLASDAEVPEFIYSDPTRLKQILINIIGNAIKFTDQGDVRVVISLLPTIEVHAQPLLSFSVKDTGVGIPADKQQHLFQPFTQVDSSTTRQYGGAGIGLVLSKRIANILGGDIQLVSSSPGRGSEFQVTIDPGVDADTARMTRLTLAGLHKHNRHARRSLTQMLIGFKILVAEDNEEMQLLIQHFLQEIGGAQVELVDNGKKALAKVKADDYDIILVDVMMPVMDGYEAVTKMREHGVDVPIIALSARTMHSEIKKGMAAGCDGYLTKPIAVNELIQAVRQYQKKRESQ
jgi:two-component system CheB/CheR fusion protein